MAAERQGRVGGGERVLVVAGAAGGAVALPTRPAIPGGDAGLAPADATARVFGVAEAVVDEGGGGGLRRVGGGRAAARGGAGGGLARRGLAGLMRPCAGGRAAMLLRGGLARSGIGGRSPRKAQKKARQEIPGWRVSSSMTPPRSCDPTRAPASCERRTGAQARPCLYQDSQPASPVKATPQKRRRWLASWPGSNSGASDQLLARRSTQNRTCVNSLGRLRRSYLRRAECHCTELDEIVAKTGATWLVPTVSTANG